MGKWSDLPLDLMECVDKYLDFAEKVRIRAASTSWNSYLPSVPKLISEELPLLLLQDSTKGASLYSVHEGKQYPLNLPELKHKIYKGSSHGWIITLEDESSSDIDEIYAFNPLTRVRIKLPPRSAFPDVKDFNPRRVGQEYIMKQPEQEVRVQRVPEIEAEQQEIEPVVGQDDEENLIYTSKRCANQFHIGKVVLSSSADNNDCMAVAIYGQFDQLAWCRPHHKQWTSFFNFSYLRPHNGVQEVRFHNGKCHALYGNGKLEIYESIDPHVTFTLVVAPPTVELGMLHHLAVCPDLGIVFASQYVRTHEDDGGVYTIDTDWIYTYKLEESSVEDGLKTWVELEGLGEHIAFLGLNLTSLIPLSDELKALGYRKNCFHYTDHHVFLTCHKYQDESDIGVFDLDELSIEGLPGLKEHPKFYWPPPIW